MKKYLALVAIFSILSSAVPVSAMDAGGEQTVSINSTGCIVMSGNSRYGMRDSAKNKDVAALQGFLYAKGYMAGAPTGIFGKVTLAAVKAFQKAQGLPATGFVGTATRAKIQGINCNTAANNLTVADNERTVSFANGQTFTVTLCGTSDGGYTLNEPTYDNTVLSLVKRTNVPLANPAGVVGACGSNNVYEFKTIKSSGTSNLDITASRGWETNAVPIKIFSIIVWVRSFSN